MILTCPACATQYSLPDGAIGAMGRRVRCQSCGETWQASADDTPLELTAAPEPVRAEAPEIAPETPAPELPRAFRARAEQQRRVRRAATHGAVWAGMACAFVALLGAGWLFRVDVVQLYPRAAAAYAMIGSPVNPVGLEFEAVGARVLPNDPGKVLVSGALRNVRDNEIVAPAVRVALLDEHGAEIGFRIVRIDAAPVLPGKVQGFAAVIPDPGGHGADVGVAFVGGAATGHGAPAHVASGHDEPVHPAPEGDDHAAPAHGEEHADAAPAVRQPPAADAGGLRPALGPTAPHADARPVDAHPVEGPTPHVAALDNTQGEAVSASHHG